MASTSVSAPTCPVCGNGLFHCGLAGYPHWCGACNWRGTLAAPAPATSGLVVSDGACPKCGRATVPGVVLDLDACKGAPRLTPAGNPL